MDISPSVSILLALSTAVIIAYYYYKNVFSFWSNQGLAGPRPYAPLGSFLRVFLDRNATTKWMREYGKVYGVYEGAKPVLVVSDRKVMCQICIKDFDKFPNHRDNELGSELIRNFIFNTKDDHWRRIRALLSPTFTSGKMRRMFKLIDRCADTMIESMHERTKSKNVVNLKDLFGLYTMDAIASCCYGLRLMSYTGEASLTTASNRDEFVKLALKLFDFEPWRLIVILCIPEIILKWLGIKFFSSDKEWQFARRVEQIIKKRRESGKNFDDYLQTLFDANSDDSKTGSSQSGDEGIDLEEHHVGLTGGSESSGTDQKSSLRNYKDKPLNDIEVLASATFLLLVGLETTSTLLTHCFYALSFHQDVQEKLYQTVKSMAKSDDSNRVTFDYDSLTSCQYLDAVISETLRRHPPAMFTDRMALEDYRLKSHNLHIPKGTKVIFTLKSIMEDPDNWTDPQVFDPERFMPANQHMIKQYSYCPFGIGPRHCLGMRFSLTESKMAVAKLLMEFKFEPAPGLQYPGEAKFNLGLNSIKRPEVVVTRR